ncbi:hypothetical protein BKA62DRAFT_756510 [Auriculariales sp. MPI-PUGE-AT-0066]|nr:hypothetical protein BKA62DRAFT_756510 [Auriculariales sp. MPI-PUGE-AT-0066]
MNTAPKRKYEDARESIEEVFKEQTKMQIEKTARTARDTASLGFQCRPQVRRRDVGVEAIRDFKQGVMRRGVEQKKKKSESGKTSGCVPEMSTFDHGWCSEVGRGRGYDSQAYEDQLPSDNQDRQMNTKIRHEGRSMHVRVKGKKTSVKVRGQRHEYGQAHKRRHGWRYVKDAAAGTEASADETQSPQQRAQRDDNNRNNDDVYRRVPRDRNDKTNQRRIIRKMCLDVSEINAGAQLDARAQTKLNTRSESEIGTGTSRWDGSVAQLAHSPAPFDMSDANHPSLRRTAFGS